MFLPLPFLAICSGPDLLGLVVVGTEEEFSGASFSEGAVSFWLDDTVVEGAAVCGGGVLSMGVGGLLSLGDGVVVQVVVTAILSTSDGAFSTSDGEKAKGLLWEERVVGFSLPVGDGGERGVGDGGERGVGTPPPVGDAEVLAAPGVRSAAAAKSCLL